MKNKIIDFLLTQLSQPKCQHEQTNYSISDGVKSVFCMDCGTKLWSIRVPAEEDELYDYAKGC